MDGRKGETRMPDPRRACAYLAYGLVGDPDGEHNIGRFVYWYSECSSAAPLTESDVA